MQHSDSHWSTVARVLSEAGCRMPSSPTYHCPCMCAAVLGAAAVLVVLLLGLLHARRQRSSGHSLWGKLLPPGVGPGTTLLVTDIQVPCACCNARVRDAPFTIHEHRQDCTAPHMLCCRQHSALPPCSP
jgi:hypothetical protein